MYSKSSQNIDMMLDEAPGKSTGRLMNCPLSMGEGGYSTPKCRSCFLKSQGIIYLETSHKFFNDVVRITSF